VSAALEARAETIKLARLLGVEADELSYLQDAPPDDLRRFREQVTDALFARDRARLGRFAAGSRVTPAAIAATIAERALGPVLCARLSGLIEPGKAVEIARRLPPPFLADVAVEMDPRRAVDVIARLPAELIAAVAGELAAREEFVTMGRFVGFLGDDALKAAIGAMDDSTVLQTAFVMERKDRLDRIIALLPPERLDGVIAAADGQHLWPETLDLLMHLHGERRAAIIDRADPDVIHALAEAAGRDELWPQLLEIADQLTPEQLDQVSARLLGEDLERHLPALIEAVDGGDRWETGLRLLAALPPDVKGQMAQIASTLDGAERTRALEQAERHGVLEALGPIGEALRR
jgi:hypothetical protein